MQPERDLRGNGRVLVVDDEPTIAELIDLSLNELGYCVTALTDSCVAATLLDAGTEVFDALVVDQTMPGLSGHGLARRMRARHQGASILLCTSLGEDALPLQEGMDMVDARLRKPYRPRELASRLRSLLDGE